MPPKKHPRSFLGISERFAKRFCNTQAEALDSDTSDSDAGESDCATDYGTASDHGKELEELFLKERFGKIYFNPSLRVRLSNPIMRKVFIIISQLSCMQDLSY